MNQDNAVAQLAQQLLEYAHQGNWRMLVAIALSGVIWLLRTFLMGPTVQRWKYVGAVAGWFRTDRGGVVLTLLVGVLGGVMTALSAGVSLSVDLFVTGVVNGLLASGFFVGLKKLFGLGDGTAPKGTFSSGSTRLTKKEMGVPITGVALFFALSLGAQGCYCLQAANANKLECIVAQHEIDCATQDIKEMLPKLYPLVAWIFAGASGPLDTSAIITALEQTGFKFVGCSAAQLEQDFSTDPTGTTSKVMASLPSPMRVTVAVATAGNPLALSFHQGYQTWRAKRAGYRFCFSDNGKKVCR
jgi:hypothetical protein